MKFKRIILSAGLPVAVAPHIPLVTEASGRTVIKDSSLDVVVAPACIQNDQAGELLLTDGFMQRIHGDSMRVRPDSKRTTDVYLLVHCPVDLEIVSSGHPVPLLFGEEKAGAFTGQSSQIWRVCNLTTLRASFAGFDYLLTNNRGELALEKLAPGNMSQYVDKGVDSHPPFCVARHILAPVSPYGSLTPPPENHRPSREHVPPPGGDILSSWLPHPV